MKSIINIKVRAILLVSLLAGSFSCDNDFDEINTDPTKFNSLDNAFQFSWVVRRMTAERFENLERKLDLLLAMGAAVGWCLGAGSVRCN